MKKNNFDKNIFIKDYEELKSARKMAEKYGCNKTTILNYAKSIGYDNSHNKIIKLAQKDLNKIIEEYEKTYNLKETAKVFNCSATALANYFKKNNYSTMSARQKINLISNEDFVKTFLELQNTELMAKKYNCSKTTINKKLNDLQLREKYPKQYKLSKEDKEYILDNYQTMTSNELAKKFNVSRGMITKIWYDNNLSGKAIKNPKTTALDIKGQIFGEWTVLNKTDRRSNSGNIYWLCRCSCGLVREVSGQRLRNGSSTNCGCKSPNSYANEKIDEILTGANIYFEREKIFKTCKYKNCLPFDFFVENKYAIEFDGKQHFDETSKYYNKDIKIRDNIKSKWCKENNIPLIRIPSWKSNSLCLQDLLLETSQFIE